MAKVIRFSRSSMLSITAYGRRRALIDAGREMELHTDLAQHGAQLLKQICGE